MAKKNESLELELRLKVIKEQEAVAKDQKDLGFLRFLVEQRNKTQDEIYMIRLERSIALKNKSIKAVELVKDSSNGN